MIKSLYKENTYRSLFYFTLFILVLSIPQNSLFASGILSSGPSYELGLAHPFIVVENVLYLNGDMREGDILFITDLKGKKMFGYVHEMDISKIKLPSIAHGMYTVTQVRNNNVIHGNRITIGMTTQK